VDDIRAGERVAKPLRPDERDRKYPFDERAGARDEAIGEALLLQPDVSRRGHIDRRRDPGPPVPRPQSDERDIVAEIAQRRCEGPGLRLGAADGREELRSR